MAIMRYRAGDIVHRLSPTGILVASAVLKENPDDPDSPRLLKYAAWSAPVLSHGLLYVRGKEQLVCLEVIPLAPNPK